MTSTSPVTSLASQQAAANSSDSTNAAIDSTDSLGNENTFLQLLVAQIQNQDPTQPIDSSTFLTQLAQFSQLEQLIGIRQDVGQLDPTASTGTPSRRSVTRSDWTSPAFLARANKDLAVSTYAVPGPPGWGGPGTAGLLFLGVHNPG